MNMKKYLLTILLGAFGAMAIAAPALAATSVSFTPVNVSVRKGQTFTLTIGVNPQGAKNYTAKTEFHYPADLLEVKSFTFAPSWMPLAQSGYDLNDNTNGVFIKTAGLRSEKTDFHYPADLLEVKSFTFAPSWMPLAQSGYDLNDNTNGVFIKTAGL